MNAQETVILCRMIRSLCPTQVFDDYTMDAWAMVLDDIPFTDAQQTVKRIYRDQGDDTEWVRKIEADDIIRQCRRTRSERIAKVADAVPPPNLTQAQEREWLRTLYRKAADGELVNVATRGELKPRDMRFLTKGPANA